MCVCQSVCVLCGVCVCVCVCVFACVCVACALLCAVVCYFIVNREKKRMMFIYYVHTCVCVRAQQLRGGVHELFF